MSCNNVGRDFFFGSAREQLISELESALAIAKNKEKDLVKFQILDYEIEYFFNQNGFDIKKVYHKTLTPRYLLPRLNNQNYFIEPKVGYFWVSRYNDGAEHLERLNSSGFWEHASLKGKKFYSAHDFILYCQENITLDIDELLMEQKINEKFGY